MGDEWAVFGPKPGLIPMHRGDVFAVTWQGGGGCGDPLDRDPETVARDVARGAVSRDAAEEIYGVVLARGSVEKSASALSEVDFAATERRRQEMRAARVGKLADDPAKMLHVKHIASIGDAMSVVRDARGFHVVSRAGYVLCSGSTRWRSGAVARAIEDAALYGIRLHERLAMTAYYCPASGTLLSVDVHEKGTAPPDDVVLDLDVLTARASA
jgi:N-methylhydantoinase B